MPGSVVGIANAYGLDGPGIDNGMRGRPGNLELDKETISLYTSCGPQTHPAGLDHPPRFSALAPTETVSGPLDYGVPHSISLANTTASFSFGLCGFYAQGQVEAIPTRQQAPIYRQVSGCHRLAGILKRTFGQSTPSPPRTCESFFPPHSTT